MKKKQKGQYGYRNYHRKSTLLKIGILVAFILAQLVARNFTDVQAIKNILTVMAILTVLPAANLASPYVAAFPYRTPPETFHQTVSPYEEKFVILYDLVITTKDSVLPMDAIIVHPTGVYAYCINKKANAQNAEKALNDTFKEQRLDPNLKIMKEEQAFMKRLKSLKPASEYEDDGTTDYAVRVLKSLSM